MEQAAGALPGPGLQPSPKTTRPRARTPPAEDTTAGRLERLAAEMAELRAALLPERQAPMPQQHRAQRLPSPLRSNFIFALHSRCGRLRARARSRGGGLLQLLLHSQLLLHRLELRLH